MRAGLNPYTGRYIGQRVVYKSRQPKPGYHQLASVWLRTIRCPKHYTRTTKKSTYTLRLGCYTMSLVRSL